MIIETFRQALQNVWSNKLRTFLTMLGIIIGVMAVIVIVGLGNGMTQSMRDSFSALGTNALSIQVWGYGSRTASVEDVYKRQAHGRKAVPHTLGHAVAQAHDDDDRHDTDDDAQHGQERAELVAPDVLDGLPESFNDHACASSVWDSCSGSRVG